MRTASIALASALLLGSLAAAVDVCTANTANATETPNLTQGPYHITEVPELFRQNVTEGQAGIPLHLEIAVLDTNCQPVTTALLEMWSANATGYYSGVVGQTPGAGESADTDANANTTFLRGVVEVDATSGVGIFDTILPGWYMGRAAHVHYAVHIPTVSGVSEEAEWNSTYVTHIGQVFFQDSVVTAAHQYAPYSETDISSATYLDQDSVFSDSGDDAYVVSNYTQIDSADFSAGGVAYIQSIVDVSGVDSFGADYSATGSSMGGGMNGGPGGAGGPMPGMANGPKPSGAAGGPLQGTVGTSAGTSAAGRKLLGA